MRKMNPAELNRWIGSQIYKERIARKISQEVLSEAAGVSRVFLSMTVFREGRIVFRFKSGREIEVER